MGRFDDSPEGLPGYVHFLGRFFLVHPFKVCQTNCLKLVESEVDMLQNRKGNSPWLVVISLRHTTDPSAMSWSGHKPDYSLMVADILAALQLVVQILLDQFLRRIIHNSYDKFNIVLFEKLLSSLAHSAGND